MSYKTLATKDTGYYADTVEWCPIEGFRDFLVCGTYQLIHSEESVETSLENQDGGHFEVKSDAGRRVGDIQLYQLDSQSKDLNKHCISAKGAGILDTKWYQNDVNGKAVLGAVSAESDLKIISLSRNKGLIVELTEQCTKNIGSDKICLSLDWSHKNSAPTCVVSDSQGQLTVLQCSEASWETRQIMQWTAHGYEAWITAFDRWSSNIIYSGGDDCLLRGWDTRTDCGSPIFTSRKHEMGVSSIQCNPVYDNIVATGSYDESIFIWDTRNRKTPLTSASPGGGVWRIKWHPHTGTHILTATMYEGYHVLKYSNGQGVHGLECVTSYQENAELAYGADWCQLDRGNSNSPCQGQLSNGKSQDTSASVAKSNIDTDFGLVATCSFYDHILHLWKVCL